MKERGLWRDETGVLAQSQIGKTFNLDYDFQNVGTRNIILMMVLNTKGREKDTEIKESSWELPISAQVRYCVRLTILT